MPPKDWRAVVVRNDWVDDGASIPVDLRDSRQPVNPDIIAISMITTALGIALLTQGSQNPIVEYKNIVYSTAGGVNLMLDITKKKVSAKPVPVLLLVHGGGWVAGSRADMASLAPIFAQYDFACVNIEYRLAPQFQWPAQLDDLQAAVRWIRANNTYNFDKTRIAAFGISAGGHLVSMLGVNPANTKVDAGTTARNQINAVISYAGPTDMIMFWQHRVNQPPADRAVVESCLPALFGGTYEEVPKKYKEASPFHVANRNSTPMMFLQGDIDTLVPKEQTINMFNNLQSKGVDTDIIVMPGVGHGGFGDDPNMVLQRMLTFLSKNLKITSTP